MQKGSKKGERGTGNGEWGYECGNVETANTNVANGQFRIQAPDGFRKGRDPFPFRPQRLTQVASRHARVTLASMWLRRAMPYATIDSRVEVGGTRGKSDCGVAATGGVVATSVLTQLLRPAMGRLR